MKIKISQENIDNGINKPSKGTKFSAGIDVYSPVNFRLEPGRTLRIPLGISIEVDQGEVAIMSERSSMGANGITSIGNIIDSDYRGIISIILQNNNNESFSFKKNERIGQIVVCKLGDNYISIVDELSETERGSNGFGSSGR